jgi:hypothetical protein
MNYSFSEIASGEFYIYQNEEKTTSGTFDVFIRYVGLKISYGLLK